jgi:hypothetical protein
MREFHKARISERGIYGRVDCIKNHTLRIFLFKNLARIPICNLAYTKNYYIQKIHKISRFFLSKIQYFQHLSIPKKDATNSLFNSAYATKTSHFKTTGWAKTPAFIEQNFAWSPLLFEFLPWGTKQNFRLRHAEVFFASSCTPGNVGKITQDPQKSQPSNITPNKKAQKAISNNKNTQERPRQRKAFSCANTKTPVHNLLG